MFESGHLGEYRHLGEYKLPTLISIYKACLYLGHGWQGGEDGDSRKAYDFVAAFEINPDFALIKS